MTTGSSWNPTTRSCCCGRAGADRAAARRQRVETEGLTVADRFGIARPHPLLATERDCRTAFLRALAALGLDIGPSAASAGRRGGDHAEDESTTKGQRAGNAPTFAELGPFGRFWIVFPCRASFLDHPLGVPGSTVRTWLESAPGRALVARYPHLAPERWGVWNPHETAAERDAEYAAHWRLMAECDELDGERKMRIIESLDTARSPRPGTATGGGDVRRQGQLGREAGAPEALAAFLESFGRMLVAAADGSQTGASDRRRPGRRLGRGHERAARRPLGTRGLLAWARRRSRTGAG